MKTVIKTLWVGLLALAVVASTSVADEFNFSDEPVSYEGELMVTVGGGARLDMNQWGDADAAFNIGALYYLSDWVAARTEAGYVSNTQFDASEATSYSLAVGVLLQQGQGPILPYIEADLDWHYYDGELGFYNDPFTESRIGIGFGFGISVPFLAGSRVDLGLRHVHNNFGAKPVYPAGPPIGPGFEPIWTASTWELHNPTYVTAKLRVQL